MSKITVKQNNLKDFLKKGFNIALATVIVGSLTSCADEAIITEEITTNTPVVDTVPEELTTALSDEYDYVEDTPGIEETNSVYDWTNTKSILTEKDKECWNLLYYTQIGSKDPISKNRYALAVCEEDDKFGETYCRIVDSKGEYLDEEKYSPFTAQPVNDHTLLLKAKDEKADHDYKEQKTYIIFDQITGKKTNIKSNLINVYGEYIEICSYTEDDQLVFELLNADGSKARNDTYTGDQRVFDARTKNLFFIKDGNTEVINTQSKKTGKIVGEVQDASNGFIVLRNDIEGEYKEGVYRFENIDSELEEVLPCQYYKLRILKDDKDSPIFTLDNKDTGEEQLLTSSGENLINIDYDFYMYDYLSDTIKAYNLNSYGVETTSYFDLYDSSGDLIDVNIYYNTCNVIPGTDMAIYQLNEGNQYGIISFKYCNHEYEIPAKYDNLLACQTSFQEDNNASPIKYTYIIGRNESNNETVILTTTGLETIAKGDYGLMEAQNIADGYYIKGIKEHQKTLKK